MRYVRNEKGLVIGQRTAEDLKIDIASAKEAGFTQSEDVLLRGRDVRTGKPSTVSISQRDVYKAIVPPLQTLLENIREAFENTPPELAADILERGIYLSGGGARLDGLRDRLSQMLKMPCTWANRRRTTSPRARGRSRPTTSSPRVCSRPAA